jgi:predicted ribosome quality control (RQC) complex YloA/Tae2 family protein
LAKEYLLLMKSHHQKKLKRQTALEKDLIIHQKNVNFKIIAEAIQIEPNLSWENYPNPFHLTKPSLSFLCNYDGVNHLFRLFKKAKQGIQEVNFQIKLNKESIENYSYHIDLLLKPNMNNLSLVQSFLAQEQLISGIKPKPIQVSHQSPYFVMDDNIKYSFGKNSKQNDFLTFSIAKKNDIFMHIYGEPGSHLILHHPTFDHDAIIKGAQLVLALAKKISGEITYAKVGSLKRTTQIGQVVVKDGKKIKVNANPNWANQVLLTIKRY